MMFLSDSRRPACQWTGKHFFLFLLAVSGIVSSYGFLQNNNQGGGQPDSCRYEAGESGHDRAQRIVYNQQSRKREAIRYQIIAAEECEPLARRIEKAHPDRFTFHKTTWGKFPDGTDNIEIGGFYPQNVVSGEHVLFLASFHNNDVTLSQFQVMIGLLQSFIESLTVVLPYSPVGKSMKDVAFYQS
jgi:hypothetical protein